MQVAGESRDLEFAHHRWLGGVGEIDRVEGVDLAEGDHVAHVAGEAHRLHLFAPADVAHRADLGELAVGFGQHPHPALGVCAPAVAGGGHHPQVPGVLGQGELVVDLSGHAARGGVDGPRGVADVEAVDVGAELGSDLVPVDFARFVGGGVDPGGGGHVHRLEGGVDGLAGASTEVAAAGSMAPATGTLSTVVTPRPENTVGACTCAHGASRPSVVASPWLVCE